MKKIIRDEKTGLVKKVQTINDQPSLTQQHFKSMVNINNILKKYNQTGQITHLAKQAGTYADLANIPDFQGALNQVQRARDAFMSLESSVRSRFGNDPHQLIEFLKNPANNEEAYKLKLKVKPVTPENATNLPPITSQKP